MKLSVAVSALLVVLLSGCQTLPSVGSGTADNKSSSAPAGMTNALGALGGLASSVPGIGGSVDKSGNLLSAAADLGKAANITDDDVKKMASAFAKQSDGENKLAAANSVYSKRLIKLTRSLANYDGMKLDFKVYMSDTVNAFAMADGTVRVYSGLMDLMNDDELRFVIGHEVAHVKLGHSMASIKNGYQSSAIVKTGAAAVGSNKTGATVMGLGGDQLKGLFQKVLTSAHSRGQESDADAYSVAFMKKNKIPSKAASSALLKLAKGSGSRGTSFLSTHPDPSDRAAAVDKIASK